MLSEQRNPRSAKIDQSSSLEIIQLMNQEDATVAAMVGRAAPEIAEAVDAIVQRFHSGGRLIYVGAGTSGRLAMLDAVECVPTFSIDPQQVQALVAGGNSALTQSVEAAEDNAQRGRDELAELDLTSDDAVVGIAASGRTPYVLAAIEAANTVDALTIGVSCNQPAPLLDIAQIGIVALVGPEIIAGSTRLKSGTAQKMILNMLSTGTMIRMGKVYGNLMVDVQPTNQKLIERACGIITAVTELSEQAAAELLKETGYEVKTAIVAYMLGLSSMESRVRLNEAQGRLRSVLESEKPGG